MVLDAIIAPQRGHLFPWVPVCLACGIGAYFLLPSEPSVWAVRGAALAALGLLLLARYAAESLAPLLIALALVAAGSALAPWRAAGVAAPVLSFTYYGPIEGRIIEIDRSLSDRTRLTLDRVVLTNTPPHRTPSSIRVSLHDAAEVAPLAPGTSVILTGHLSPPMGPAEPGAFDFRRTAWFESLGAVGYTRTPVLVLEPAEPDTIGLWLTGVRMRLSHGIQAQVGGQSGALASSLLTGDRSGLDSGTMDAMRQSNLSHIVSISGLHMALLCGFVFVAVRSAIAIVPPLALRIDGRKWAAVVAIGGATAYLALSGGNVATQRAYLMVLVMLCAVLLDRRALSLRSVALAAFLILLKWPEMLLNIGFQLSFAATAALIWVFDELRGSPLTRGPRWLRPVVAMALSSGVAGLATAPLSAASFNQVAQYGLMANMASLPVMGMLVMPAAVVAACLAPLGLEALPLWAMGMGCRWVLAVAHWTAGLDGALRPVQAPPGLVVPVLVLGGLFVMLWQGRARWAGVAPMLLALALWSQSSRPAVLIAESGGLVGVLRPDGRVLNKSTGDTFTARAWLEDDGDRRTPEEAARPDKRAFEAEVEGLRLRLVTKRQLRGLADPCAGTDILISPEPVPGDPACLVFDGKRLERSGAVALRRGKAGLDIMTAGDVAGRRYWTDRPLRDQLLNEPRPPAEPLLARLRLYGSAQ